MKILSIGCLEFASVQQGNYLYVDKTEMTHGLLTSKGGRYFFLFGKSLTISIPEAIFEGHHEMFGGRHEMFEGL